MRRVDTSSQIFWQTAFAVVLGTLTGVLILTITHKRPAEALSKSTLGASLPVVQNSGFGGIQILPMLSNRMNVLVMGVDSNGLDAQRFVGTRSDTMILVSMDPIAHKVGIVSIPRDSRVKISGNHGTDKINSAHAFGGPQLAVQTVAESFLVPIDHYVVVDTQALKQLCNLLGPIDVLVEKPMKYTDWSAHLHIDLKPGWQTLSPEQVEQYVRFRHDARGDIGRIERQQWFFRQAANKMKDPQFVLHLPDLIRIAHDYIQTDLTLEDMARIATFAKEIKPETVVSATVPGQPQMISGISYWIPDFDQSKLVFNRILGLPNNTLLVADGETSAQSTVQGNLVNTDGRLRPISIALKYPRGADSAAQLLEQRLTQQGYVVRYKWSAPLADCQHEQIIQNSLRADDNATDELRKMIPDVGYWPVSISLESRPAADFTLTLTPETAFSTSTRSASSLTSHKPVLPD